MANKNDTTPAAAEVTTIPLSLHEFCSRLSVKVNKPELIAGFEHTERVAGNLSDTDEAFTSRFNDFANKPV